MESRLGRYLVLKHLASGGMADVLLGRADGIEGFERHVVLKRIRPEYARDQRFIRMFLDEARVAANLHHQHIVQVHDIGEVDGEYFIAMEYIHGEDVRMVLSTASKRRAHVPLVHTIAIVSAAAAGLHYAHERRGSDLRPLGIVHRDISPSNILVGYDGAIKLLDFGLATASMRQETGSGSLKGKISYMSPEQCRGLAVDRRSDVYSLGVVLYELATTTRLFKGDTDYVVMDQIVKGRVSLPQVRRPDLPNELSAIIMRAIATDPERRFFTADELRVALDQFASKAGIVASPSAIAAYMHKQFGERPEPWLELEAQGIYSFDDLELPIEGEGESTPRPAWAELPRSDDAFQRVSSSIPRQSSPMFGAAGNFASDAGSPDGMRPQQAIARVATTPPPTRSPVAPERPRSTWVSRLTPLKLAMMCAPLLLIVGVGIGRLLWTGVDPSAVATAPPPPVAPPAPAPTPVAPPAPQPPPPAVAVVDPIDSTDKTVARGSDATPGSKSHTSQTPARRTSTTSIAKADTGAARTAPSSAKSDTAQARTPASGAKAEVAATAPLGVSAAPAAPAPSASQPAAAPASAAVMPTPVVPLPPPPPPPALPAAPQSVAPTALDANRIAGDKEIVPDNSTQTEISRAGVERLNGSFKLCITASGDVNTVTPLKSTGFVSYDIKIQNTIRNRWRYKPFIVNGKATAVCTAVRFIYSQK